MNDSQVTIVICWEPGTDEMLTACLKSICRHTKDVPYRVLLVSRDTDESFYHTPVLTDHEASFEIGRTEIHIPVDPGINPLRIHGALLDAAIPKHVFTEYVLTLDSDCFPVADGWLSRLEEMLETSAVAGIFYPWQPIPPDVNARAIERRIRTAHCWNNVQVVCMLTRKAFIVDNGISYRAGDDTGFHVCHMAHALCLPVSGWKPTRCALSDDKAFDPELNRHVAVVYGDMVYHHGGATRTETLGQKVDKGGLFDSALKEVIARRGAEFLLEDGRSHVYRFDDEEKVSDFKMASMYEAMTEYLKTHTSLFGK